jgi:nucleotide-binding universal stress UspA family protein
MQPATDATNQPAGAHNDAPLQWVSLDGDVAATTPLATLVVGYDRRPESQYALQEAVDLARRLVAQLQVVHAVDVSDYPLDPDSFDWEQRARQALDEERVAVSAALDHHIAGWSYRAGYGDPAELLVAVAEETDALMIIVGSRGEGWKAALDRLLAPSVSHRVIQRCRRPVLVVSHPVTVSEGAPKCP